MISATQIYINSLTWLKNNYSKFCFFVERDIVWTIQTHLFRTIIKEGLPLRVYNDYGILPGKRRRLSTDIAILNNECIAEVAIEFKYEPSHERKDIPPHKFPVVVWGKDGVEKDIHRIRKFVTEGNTKKGYTIFIDEGSYFKHQEPYPGSEWLNWGNGVWVLWSEYPE